MFVVETGLIDPVAPSPFLAFGSAVETGVVCPSGTVVNDSGKATGFTRNGFNFQGVKHFTCDDGSGEFFANLEARIDFRKGDTFNWNVLRGTGEYSGLHGSGRGFGFAGDPCGDPEACILDVYVGGLHRD